ncbi:MAG: hypothetical protein KF900_03070 [Bacteroidetes bacterium]|nr:hypothetical protein [Bacteroidota bacterium]
MKKVLLIAAVASLGMASCRKNHSCTCKDSTDTYTFTAKSSKKDAKSWCEATTTSLKATGYTCTLD